MTAATSIRRLSKSDILSHLGDVLSSTHFNNLGEFRQGKVRDIYLQKDHIILIASDRYSAFDRQLALVPFKGELLTAIAQFWFENTKDIIANHVIAIPDPNVIVGQYCTLLPIEVVVRGYMTGVTNTSLWTLYQNGARDFGDFQLPDGMQKNQRLISPVITPTTKDTVHDQPISGQAIIEQGILSASLWQQVQTMALALFERGSQIAREKGLLLVDTKYEFGLDSAGKLIVIDEIHTPDSSRFWQAATYEEKFHTSQEPDNFDKEFLRLWFKANCDPYQDTVLPKAPDEMIAELAWRYVLLYEQITGRVFAPHYENPIESRIRTNLASYFDNTRIY